MRNHTNGSGIEEPTYSALARASSGGLVSMKSAPHPSATTSAGIATMILRPLATWRPYERCAGATVRRVRDVARQTRGAAWRPHDRFQAYDSLCLLSGLWQPAACSSKARSAVAAGLHLD